MRAQIEAALRALAEANGGRLTPDAVVEAASEPDSPLHPCFEWDDTEAAARYRLDQARTLIRSVRVVVRTDTREVSTVYYLRDPEQRGDEQGYVSLPRLRDDADVAREAVVAEFARAAAALKRARDLAVALGLSEVVDRLIEDVAGAQRRVAPPRRGRRAQPEARA